MIRPLLLLSVAAALYYWWQPPARRAPLNRWLASGAAIVLALLYLRSPIDLIPDATVVGLLDDLLVLLTVFWWVRERLRTRPLPPPGGTRHRPDAETPRNAWDPYAVLGVSRGASPAEITHAYRERMKEYHPDRVNGLGEELQRLAHQKTLDIRRAYDELRAD